MPKRKRILTQQEIENIVANWDDISEGEGENYADSESDCEEEVHNESIATIRDERFSVMNCSFSAQPPDDDVAIISQVLQSKDVVSLPGSSSTSSGKKSKVPSEFQWVDVSKALPSSDAVIHSFGGNPQILKPCVLQCDRELDFLRLFFDDELLDMIVEESNKYQRQNSIGIKKNSSNRSHHALWKDLTKNELVSFLAVTLLCGHVEKDTIEDYWSHKEEIETPYFRKIMPLDRFKLILRCLHFSDNSCAPSKTDTNYDRLWKMRSLFEKLVDKFKRCYEPKENLVIDEVIVTFKGRVIFRQYIPKKHKRWGIKVYKLCDESAYTYDMRVYLGKDRDECFAGKSAVESVVLKLIESVRGKGHNLFVDNFFTSPKLFLELRDNYLTNCCGTVQKNRKEMPKNIQPRNRGDINAKCAKGLMAVCWKDKRDVYVLSSMHPPTTDTLRNVSEEIKKPRIINSYNKNMGFVDLSDRMANSYGFSRKTMKWPKKLFFHFLNIAVLNAYILFKMKRTVLQNQQAASPAGDPNLKKIDHKTFRLNLIKQMIEMNCSNDSPLRQGVIPNENVGHWPEKSSKRRRCVQCHKNKKETKSWIQCKSCAVGLCLGKCYEDYHISLI